MIVKWFPLFTFPLIECVFEHMQTLCPCGKTNDLCNLVVLFLTHSNNFSRLIDKNSACFVEPPFRFFASCLWCSIFKARGDDFSGH